jgi:geranylgeranyl diphosphate synthase, type I
MKEHEHFRSAFEPVLEQVFERMQSRATSRTHDATVRWMVKELRPLLLTGGKRIRPYMAWVMYRGLGGKKSQTLLEFLAALELFHLFALVHDDIIDRGADRHGVPTAHVAIQRHLQKAKRLGDLAHLSNGQAVLLGDLLLSWSAELIARNPHVDTLRHAKAKEYFHAMSEEVIVGQMLDVDLMTRAETDTATIEEKLHLKTAGYTFVRPMQIGAALAGITPGVERFCEAYGLSLGLAFQIQDDLFDVTLSAEQLGKTVFSDLSDRQHTLFTQYIFERGTAAQKKTLNALFGTRLSETDRARIEELFRDSGALLYGRERMHRYFDAAGNALRRAPLEESAKHALQDLVVYLRQRTV